MKKTREQTKYRSNLSKSLKRHIITAVLCQFCSMTINIYLCMVTGKRIFLVLTVLFFVVLLAEIWGFVGGTLNFVIEIEEKINELRRADQLGETEGERTGEMGLMETIQFLLQKESAANLMKKQAEIEALQSQINPHFLYNTLETIRGQAMCCGANEIAETTKALADIFRFNISKKGAMIYLYEEMAIIDAYMKIQRTRFNDRFSLAKEIDDELMGWKIPKLLIQPLVENALKHGLEAKRGKGHIQIRAYRTEDTLFVTVIDNGIGMNVAELAELNKRMASENAVNLVKETSASVGLININDRIQMLYGARYGVVLRSVQGMGTEATVMIGIAGK